MKFIFYNPSKVIGGAEYLFYRLYVSLKGIGAECGVVDYKDGAFLKLGGSSNDLIAIDSVYDKCIVECDYFVLPPNLSYEALYSVMLNDDSKVVFWSIHPLNCVPTLPFSFYKKLAVDGALKRCLDFAFLRKQRDFAKRLFSMASESKSIFFMDLENHTVAAKFIGRHLNNILLPIPAPEISSAVKVRSIRNLPSDEYIFYWVGRLVDFKVGSLNRLILDLDEWCLSARKKVSLFIVGSGDHSSSVIEPRHLKMVKLGHIENDKLHCLINNNADAVFGMGTSILESAALGVASFIVMPTYQHIGDAESYILLPETRGYTLGSFADKGDTLCFKQLELEDLLRNNEFGEACADYVKNNHDLDVVRDKLVALSESSALRYADASRRCRKFFLTRFIYSFFVGR